MTEATIFIAALEKPTAAERAAFLADACAGDERLRRRVEALLRAHATPDDILDPTGEPPGGTCAPISHMPAGEPVGAIVAGRYKLLEPLGEGGMGTVWAAEQTTPVRRKVALKVIKAGMDSRSVLARFEAERQALALMDHPNIAKVLDGGLTDSGRPYFVMEYVKGVPITEYCDATRLSVAERLNLFVQVCSALQHAHQKGIIHRDLKPSNILVAPYDDKPVPKVIDFGLAKAMHQSLTEKTLYTAHEMVLGTPLYMAPEQAQLNNLDIDTRADIYSLGVLLYELVTGTTPLERKRFKEAAWDEIRRIIREEEPPTPSTRLSTTDMLPSLAVSRQTEPAKLKKVVRGELDWIVMKALEKDRTRRYETANGLARDIQRHLDDEVVEARPPSSGYRLRKFVRRHKAQVMAAGLVLLALLAGIAGTTWGLFREARANVRLAESLTREQIANADLSAANAKVKARYDLAVDAIKTFHTGVSEDFLLKEEKFKDLRNRLLRSASDFYGRLAALLGRETDAASRRALAAANFELAILTGMVGRPEHALAAHRSVLAMRRALVAEPGAGAAVLADVGRSLTRVATLLELTGRSDEATATYREAESLLASPATESSEARAALADCRSRLGWLLSSIGKHDDALAALRLARADQEALALISGASNEARRDLADTLVWIGVLLANSGRPGEAEPEYRKAVAIFRKLADENPASCDFSSGLASSHGNLGILLEKTGRPRDAEAEHRSAMVIFRKLADENPAVADFRNRLAISEINLGFLMMQTGRLQEAEGELRRARALFQDLTHENPAVSGFRRGLATTHVNLGGVLANTGRTREAEAEFRAALAIQRKLAEAEPSNSRWRREIGRSLNNLGELATDAGRLVAAADWFRESVVLHERLADDYPTVTDYRYGLACALIGLGRSLHRAGRLSEADGPLRRAVALGESIPDLGLEARFNLARGLALLAAAADPRRGPGATSAASDRAMDALRQAFAAGYRNDPAQIRAEPDLAVLRGRADFLLLLMDLAMPDDPFARAAGPGG